MIKEEILRLRSLRYSIIDGIFYFLMVGFGESFFIPFALFLGAGTFQIGVLGSVPILLGAVGQILSGRIAGFFQNRRAFVVSGAAAQAFVYPVMILLFLLEFNSVTLFILLVCLYQIFGLVIVPAWTSWMGDLVEEDQRGRYFGKRNRITGMFSLVSLVAAGILLSNWQEDPGKRMLGFVLVFIAAFLSRTLSVIFLSLKWEPKPKETPAGRISVRNILENPNYKNFRNISYFLTSKSFFVYLASPYFIPYIFESLHFSYLQFTLTQVPIILVKYACMPYWGAFSDKYGNRKTLILGSAGLSFIPLLWLVSGNFYYILVVQMYSGFIWAALELASFNVAMDNTPPEARMAGVGFFNSLNGVAIVMGSLSGAGLVYLGNLFMNGYLFVFLVSGMLRVLPLILFIRRFTEVRKVQPVSYLAIMWRPFESLNTRNLGFPFLPLFKKSNLRDK